MNNVFAETKFDCVDRDGNAFTAELQFGNIVPGPVRDGITESRLDMSLEPLFPERGMRGTDSFQAICLAIEFVRKALRAFVAHGGTVYYHQSQTPIDLDDYAFTPISEFIDPRFLAGPPSEYWRRVQESEESGEQ
ncbi:hypothetical protein NZK35_33100 [Stieleria sp. ICT_E10.1]|uniref:hypothetical protein n=1 Tax=Stieleria sedimenti TaxID=2976331 RepID=UPI0021807B09|nr:hypothetical protein [Stieleria sedimenti]MCS7471512.1 hypothetical protein [Stieleria sedimenti]